VQGFLVLALLHPPLIWAHGRGRDAVVCHTPGENRRLDGLSREFCFGYNTAVIAGALLYMEEDPGLAPLNSFEQGAIVSCALAGATLGALMLSLLDRFGHRPTLLLTAWGFVVGPAITAAAPHLALLIVGRVVAGISVGLTSGIVNLYINEIAPAHVRGELSGLAPFVGTLGCLVSFVASLVLGSYWRVQLGIAVAPALLMLLLQHNLHESPRWVASHMMQTSPNAAVSSLQRFFPDAPRAVLDEEMNRLVQASAASDAACSLSLITRHTSAFLRGVMLNVLQQVSGINVVIYFGPTILASAGFTTSAAMWAMIGVSVTQLAATMLLVKLVDVVGRRPLALWGLWMMCAGLGVLMLAFSVQGSAVHPRGLTTSLLAVSGMFLFRASFSLSLGPLPYVMTSELFPQEVRAAGVSVSWAANWWSNLLVAQSFPVLHAWLSTRLGAHGSMVMIFGGFVAFCLLGFVLVWWALPETKGISLEKAGAEQDIAPVAGFLLPPVDKRD